MNSPHHTRTPRSTLVKWLLENPDVWHEYPMLIKPPQTRSHAQRIFVAMQKDGLLAPRSQCNPKTISGLIASARISKQFDAASNVQDAPLTPQPNQPTVTLP